MIDEKLIAEILSLYKKHGWNISRVLFSGELKNSFDPAKLEKIIGDAEITEAGVNAVWFTRPSKHGRTAWELRHLSKNPFALFELSESETLPEERVREMENRLAEYASNETGGEKS
jgi:hypothetical protein